MQIFTRNQTQWKAPPLPEEEIARFRAEQGRTGIAPVVAHGSYLVNLASPDPALLARSREAFLEELRRAAALGLPCVITHPGAHMGAGVEAGLARVAASLDWIGERAGAGAPLVCLENTAGQGTVLGGDFAHFGAIFGKVSEPARLGVCVDSCHGHAAGYDLATAKGYERPSGRSRRRSAPGGCSRSTSTTPRASAAAGWTATSTSGAAGSAWRASASS